MPAQVSHALQISLEENRAEQGSVGFVDMQKVFEEYPEVRAAKEAFEKEIRAREEKLKEKRKEIAARKRALGDLQAELEKARHSALAPETANVALSTPSASIVEQAAQISSPPVTSAETPASQAQGQDILARLPGMEEKPEETVLPAVSTATPTTEAVNSTAAQEIGDIPGLEEKIAATEREIAAAEEDFKNSESQFEKELLELEKKKTQTLLGRLYRIIQEVAREEAVSVVVEKNNILFGHQAVDLTDKALAKIKGEQ